MLTVNQCYLCREKYRSSFVPLCIWHHVSAQNISVWNLSSYFVFLEPCLRKGSGSHVYAHYGSCAYYCFSWSGVVSALAVGTWCMYRLRQHCQAFHMNWPGTTGHAGTLDEHQNPTLPYPWWCFTTPKPWKQQKIINDHHRKNSFWCPENQTMSRTLHGARLVILLWGTVKICRSVIWNQVSTRREERECGVNSNLRGIFSKKRQTGQTCSNRISAAETTNSSTVIVSLLAPFFINACKMRETMIN